MGYCKGIKASTFRFTFFHFLKEVYFWQEFFFLEGMKKCFGRNFIWWVYPFFRKKEKLSPFENFESNWNIFYENYHFFYYFIYQFFLSWQCPRFWTVFIHDLLYFKTFLKVAVFSAIFSDEKLLLEWIWQQIALRSNCF